eukprot:TRINITY_DN12905_c1_g1_i1.p1 TRINITY_DN12905_c1_g1~~TRINITY_DN12905_c1_g1_i1.p1  ORF type:complete len:239 (-),score=33.57 TRINITY_DN12905_c1_g1_i1:596-1237(-)
MTSTQNAPVQVTSRRGLSDAAEQRWRQMSGGRHLFCAVAGVLEEDVQSNACYQIQPVLPLAQAMGFASGRRPMHQEHEDESASTSSAHLSQGANVIRRDDEHDTHTSGGMRISAARPIQQLCDERSQDPNAPPLPPSLQTLVDAGPFVAPDGEEWHELNGWHVRISRSELDELLARAEESDSGEESVDSRADTSVGSGSVFDSEDGESIEAER